MPRLQTFVSHEILSSISDLVEKRRREGATEKEVNVSSIGAMLIELGLRVYKAQLEQKDDLFDEYYYRKLMLENTLKINKAVSKILGMQSFAPYLEGKENFEYQKMVNEIRETTKEEIKKLFPEE
ncbi:conjugal transfer relaxosome DNA-binding protein TraM [Arsenophonus nasoniae]|uniref:Relaxosome protein TraM n=2 Tax=Arsenophonus nasoniae TaxID=638 RepID=A0AA95KF11_9GAMM|nr:conjugal transfer relaxosome DNA-binding protein TraM [Arsenophonus nasoniae]WGM03683.1 conjugal transfer relaxosome DNA-binding protein TraM [Arsenophonus nasoniae]